MLKLSIAILLIATFSDAFSYSFSRGRYGEYPKWMNGANNLTMYYNADNNSGISGPSVYQIIQSSVSQWNSHGDVSMSLYPSSVNNPYSGRNDIYFSDSTDFFSGGGVVGVTQLIYRSGTGEILEADIVLNDDYTFSSDPTDRFYLGNVVTHELGHVIGLGHSEAHGSTMFYQLTKDQYEVAQDDKSAVEVLYPPSVSHGSISGKIVGGDDLTGVFASHVQAVSKKTGEVAASAFSEDDGTFIIGGLPLDDQYYIYVGPPKYLAAQTSFYQTARINFCEGSSAYRGSFFESCYQNELGFPNAISLSNAQKSENVGMITIKCDLAVPNDLRLDSEILVTIDDSVPAGALVDFFPTANGATHRITYDLSNFSIASDSYFDLKLVSQSLYSSGDYKINVYLNKTFSDTLDAPDYTFDNLSDQRELNISADFQVTTDLFTVEIVAEDEAPAGAISEFFSDSYNFVDNYNFYFLTYGVKRKVGDSFDYLFASSYNGEDNSYCPMAPNTYSVVSNSTDYTPQKLVSQEDVVPGVSCGTVAFNGDGGTGGSGPMSLIIGFLGMMMIMASKSLLNRQV